MSEYMETKGPLHIAVKSARGEVEAVVATLGQVDRDGDIIAPGAIAPGSKVKMSSYGHDIISGAPPVGAGRIDVEGDRAIFRGRIFLKTNRGRETFQVLREMGEDQDWALGYRVISESPPSSEQRERGASRVLTKLDAIEVSPMLMSAGIGTGTVSVKAKHAHERGVRLARQYLAALEAKRKAEEALDRAETRVRSLSAKRRREARIRRVFDDELWRRRRARARGWIGPVQPVEVDPAKERRAKAYTAWAAAQWGVPAPKVTWFYPRPGIEKAGYFQLHEPDIVWLRYDLDGWTLVELAFHETSHYAFHRVGVRDSEEEIKHATRVLLDWYRNELARRLNIEGSPGARVR